MGNEKLTEEILQNETDSRRFLLGAMTENERAAFEAQFIADENLFAQTCAAEDELIESYVRGMLSAADKTNFEKYFLTTDVRRRRVDFTRTMIEKLKNQIEYAVKKTAAADDNKSVWNLLIEFFKTPKLAFGAAFVVLVLAFGSWFLILKTSKDTPELVKQISPTPTVQPSQTIAPNQNSATNENLSVNSNVNIAEKLPDNKNSLPNVNKDSPNKYQNPNPPKVISTLPAPVIALFAGGVRGEGKMSELNLPKTAAGANLQLNLESQDYKIYQVEITDPDGNSVFRKNKLRAKNTKLNLFVPAPKLRAGDYLVKLSALNSKNENESVADYSFRVRRQ